MQSSASLDFRPSVFIQTFRHVLLCRLCFARISKSFFSSGLSEQLLSPSHGSPRRLLLSLAFFLFVPVFSLFPVLFFCLASLRGPPFFLSFLSFVFDLSKKMSLLNATPHQDSSPSSALLGSGPREAEKKKKGEVLDGGQLIQIIDYEGDVV